MSFSRRQRVKLKDYFNYADFEKWLNSLPDDFIVAKPRKGVTPVVRYLECKGLKNVRITRGEPSRIKFEENGRRVISYVNGVRGLLRSTEKTTAKELKGKL